MAGADSRQPKPAAGQRKRSGACACRMPITKTTGWNWKWPAQPRSINWIKYLRAIWLECCGHLSKFTIGGWGGMDIGKTRKAEAIFEEGLTLRHLYDFGTTSETDIRVMGARTGKMIGKHPITLLARNMQPEAPCQVCGQPASWLCIECVYEEDKTGYLCDEHVADHPHEDYGEPMGVYNSPRMGMCGYDGPAEPPY